MSHYRKHHSKHNHPANSDAGTEGAEDSVAKSSLASAEHELLLSLFAELFQEEQSAKLHPLREAERLGDVPPAAALRALAAHAERVLPELPALAEKNRLPVSTAGLALGSFLSGFRQLVIDRIVEPERSYRGTLVGMRHGLDLVELIRQVAKVQNNTELAQWCAGWLAERAPLVDAVAKELEWFARVPEAAIAQPYALRLLARLMALIPGVVKSSPGVIRSNPRAATS